MGFLLGIKWCFTGYTYLSDDPFISKKGVIGNVTIIFLLNYKSDLYMLYYNFLINFLMNVMSGLV